MKMILLPLIVIFLLILSSCTLQKEGRAFQLNVGEDPYIYNLFDQLNPANIEVVLDTTEESIDVTDAVSQFVGDYMFSGGSWREEDEDEAAPSEGSRVYITTYDATGYSNIRVENQPDDATPGLGMQDWAVYSLVTDAAIVKVFQDTTTPSLINLVIAADNDNALCRAIMALRKDTDGDPNNAIVDLDNRFNQECVVIKCLTTDTCESLETESDLVLANCNIDRCQGGFGECNNDNNLDPGEDCDSSIPSDHCTNCVCDAGFESNQPNNGCKFGCTDLLWDIDSDLDFDLPDVMAFLNIYKDYATNGGTYPDHYDIDNDNDFDLPDVMALLNHYKACVE